MWVKISASGGKWVEVSGRQKHFLPGDFVDVGKQVAMGWVLNGEAEASKPGGAFADNILRSNDGGARYSLICCPMPFAGVVKFWQENALLSWAKQRPAPEVIMCYDDDGVKDEAERWGAVHVGGLERSRYGTPLIPEIWRAGQEAAKYPLVCYVNSDVMTVGMGAAIAVADRMFPGNFLMVGQRWDINLRHHFDFSDKWQRRLHSVVVGGGKLHGCDAIDWFAFRKGTFKEIPPFKIGRSAWDNWLILDCLIRGVPVIDATPDVAIVHQELPMPGEDRRISQERLEEKAENRAHYMRRRNDGKWKGITKDAPYFLFHGEIAEK